MIWSLSLMLTLINPQARSLFIKSTQVKDVLEGTFPGWYHGSMGCSVGPSLWLCKSCHWAVHPTTLLPAPTCGIWLRAAAHGHGEHCVWCGESPQRRPADMRSTCKCEVGVNSWVNQSRFSRAQASGKKLWIITYVNIDSHAYLKNTCFFYSDDWTADCSSKCYSLSISSPVEENRGTGS